jgi:hypothetical protein
VTTIILALAIGFLLGILLMVLLVSGRKDEDLIEKVEQEEARRRVEEAKRRDG